MEGIFTGVESNSGVYHDVTLEVDIGPFKKGERNLEAYYDSMTDDLELTYTIEDDECNLGGIKYTCKLAEILTPHTSPHV